MLWHVFLGAIRLPPTFEALSLTCANVLKLKRGVHPCEYCYQPHNETFVCYAIYTFQTNDHTKLLYLLKT